MTEKILIACVGASDSEGRPCGFLSQGMFIPLAATDAAREAIEVMGEDAVADWLGASEVHSPKAGGLWVFEAEEIVDDSDAPQGYWFSGEGWRYPTVAELEGLIGRQSARARGDKTAQCPPGAAAWTFIGALV